MVVICSTSSQVCKEIEGELTIGLRVLDLFVLIFCLSGFRVSFSVSIGPRLFSFCEELCDSSMNKSSIKSFVKTSFEVP